MEEVLAPGLLVAVPQLSDPNFRHSVVLLLQATSDGALGLVVNRESPLLLRDLCRDHAIPHLGDPDKRIRHGGPVHPDQGLVIYGSEHADPEGRSVVDGLHVSASTGTLTRLCSLEAGRFHCFAGYAGWGPGQLEQEIQEGSWIVRPVDSALVLDLPPEAIWDRALRDIGLDPNAIVPGGAEA